MTRKEFSDEMVRMHDTFPNFYSKERLEIVWRIVADIAPHEFRKVVDHLMNTFRQAPLPKDFYEASAGFRKGKFRDDGPSEPDCSECLDVGFIRVRYHDDVNSASLMRCACPKGETYPDLQILRWEPAMAQVFKKAACPIEWFIPRVPIVGKDGEFEYKRILPIVDQWRARLRTAELHWQALKAKTSKDLGAKP